MTSRQRRPARAAGNAAPARPRAWAAGLVAGACLMLVACGGGGGGAADGNAAAPLGLVKLTVNDRFGTPVAGAQVRGPRETSLTDSKGVALVSLSAPDSSATVILSSTSFSDQTVAISSSGGKVNEVAITLQRKASAAGGSLASRGSDLPVVSADGRQLSFDIDVVVVDADAGPVEQLGAADFRLRACTPVAGQAQAGCVRGATGTADQAYAPTNPAPAALQIIAGLPASDYAAALLLDQSGSIKQSDPSGARLFSTKAFLGGMGANDTALLAAFAGGAGAMLPTSPMTVFGPFRSKAAASAYFPSLDSLATLVGGNTPLYDSLDSLRRQVVGDNLLAAGKSKAVVVFSDGADTSCASTEACRSRRARSIAEARQDQIRIFTIGLSSGVDVAAMAELAHQSGGAFLYADNAEQLLPLYGSVGRLLSLSLPSYRLRWTVQADAAGAFRAGSTLLGRVQVTAGGSTFDVPFVVGIP